MAWNDTASDLDRLRALVGAYDHAGARQWGAALSERIRTNPDPYSTGTAVEVLSLLRRNRWFDVVMMVAEALIAADVDDATISGQYAQALVDTGRVVAALSVVEQIIAKQADDQPEYAEALGLRGRCFKQMYVRAEAPGFERNRVLLRRAIDSYRAAHKADPKGGHWHVINLVALVARAGRDGVELDDPPDGRALANDVLASIRLRWDAGDWSPWDLATAGEASLALDDSDGAYEWMGRYVESDAGSFELTGTLRQLEEVWQLRSNRLVDLLRSAILARSDGGEVVMNEPVTIDEDRLERVLGTVGVKSLGWFRTGLSRAESVARVCDPTGTTVGTAFLLEGSSLSEHLPADELFAVTNSHVVSETVSRSLYADEAALGFEAAGLDADLGVSEVVFASPPDELDVSILRLDRQPAGVAPLELAARLPDRNDDARVYVIGHPRGGGLSYSLQDNLLLDVESPRLHYRAPTDRGSSGSPVFDDQWRLVALHHAGGDAMHRLNGAAGTYAANEGISIRAIAESVHRFLTEKAGK